MLTEVFTRKIRVEVTSEKVRLLALWCHIYILFLTTLIESDISNALLRTKCQSVNVIAGKRLAPSRQYLVVTDNDAIFLS